jgi:FkbM family methyltransferase
MLTGILRQVKRALLERWLIPYSPVEQVPYCIYRRYRVNNPITIIDIGAHRGDFTLGLKKVCPVSNAVLIEPIGRLAESLRANPEFSGYSVFDCVIAAHDGEIEFNVFPDAPYTSSALSADFTVESMTSATKTAAEVVRRPARTLDSVIAQTGLKLIDLIKIDVQGLEHLVIQGAADVLARTTAVFTEVSFRPLYVRSSVFNDIYRMMYERGFVLTALESGFRTQSGELLQADALFVKHAYLQQIA